MTRMTRMQCAHTRKLIQLYLDDRMSLSQMEELRRHLVDCAACREELSALVSLRAAIVETDMTLDLMPAGAPDPADLTEAIMRRVAAYEASKIEAQEASKASKAAALERRSEFLPDFVPAWVGPRAIAVGVALVALLVTALLPGGWGAVAMTLSRDLDGAVGALLSPGPDQVLWAVWLGGGLVALLAVVWFARADASSEWRRAISERLPQLW
jgi:hypothetical protein